MDAPTDFAHAAAIARILRAHGIGSMPSGSGDRSHPGDDPLWGRGPAPGVGPQSLRADAPAVRGVLRGCHPSASAATGRVRTARPVALSGPEAIG